jgi:Beta-lactamase
VNIQLSSLLILSSLRALAGADAPTTFTERPNPGNIELRTPEARSKRKRPSQSATRIERRAVRRPARVGKVLRRGRRSAAPRAATVLDMLHFDRALRGRRLLNTKRREVMTTAEKLDEAGFGYAYDFGNRTLNGQRLYGHNGGVPGIGAQFDIYRDLGYTVVLLSNYDYRDLEAVVEKTRELMLALVATLPTRQQEVGKVVTRPKTRPRHRLRQARRAPCQLAKLPHRPHEQECWQKRGPSTFPSGWTMYMQL